MKYLLLIHTEEQEFHKLEDSELQAMLGEYRELQRELQSSGQYLTCNRLHPTSMATSVRVRNGKRLVTDGPFAETREQLGGYFLIHAGDLNDAIEIAARIPSARFGTIEVRPVREFAGLTPN